MFTDGRMDGWTDRQTDARLIAISPEPFGRGMKTGSLYHAMPEADTTKRLSWSPAPFCALYYL